MTALGQNLLLATLVQVSPIVRILGPLGCHRGWAATQEMDQSTTGLCCSNPLAQRDPTALGWRPALRS
jgi:hypothetical protein